MQSNGGLASAVFAAAAPAHIIESGPAAGVVGGAALARLLHEPGIITFDMGGTTAKAGLVERGEVIRTEAIEVGGGVMAGSRLLVGAGYMLKLPAIDLAEVGAGGARSAGWMQVVHPKLDPTARVPIPVLFVTVVAVSPRRPSRTAIWCSATLITGGLVGGTLRLDRDAATAAIARDLAGPLGCSVEDAAFGMLRLASATMMRAIRMAVSVERGRDPREFALLAFGGNGRFVRPRASLRSLGSNACWCRRCRACSAPSVCWSPIPSITSLKASVFAWTRRILCESRAFCQV